MSVIIVVTSIGIAEILILIIVRVIVSIVGDRIACSFDAGSRPEVSDPYSVKEKRHCLVIFKVCDRRY